jgi:hypothetical protein
MSDQSSLRFAAGGPGIEPRWTRGAKTAVGTAYSTSSRVWYTESSIQTAMWAARVSAGGLRSGSSVVRYELSLLARERKKSTYAEEEEKCRKSRN